MIIILLVIVLMVFGAKSTWKIAERLSSGITDLDSLVFVIIVFVLIFVIAAPIMGVINIIKLIGRGREKDIS